jgi:hypothetical protein
VGPGLRAFRIGHSETLCDLIFQRVGNRTNARFCEVGEFPFMNRLFIVEAGEQHLKQLPADLPEGTLGRKVVTIRIIEPADFIVGNEDVADRCLNRAFHTGANMQRFPALSSF